MPYELSDKLAVGVASSAHFDQHGEARYRIYQDERIGDTLQTGVAFPFINRLLNLNDLRPEDPLVEVIILSHVQQVHLEGASEYIAGVHIPYGVANDIKSATSADVAFPPTGDVSETEMADAAR